jgi:hypothetical protein
MRRIAELYGAWIFGVLCTCGLAYWFYRHTDSLEGINAEDVTLFTGTDDTVDTGTDDIITQVRPRFRGSNGEH